jgi:hypothetical protein
VQHGEVLSEPSERRRLAKQGRIAGEFVRGPIPVAWIARAAKLPGRALAVGLALWFIVGVGRRSNAVCPTLLQKFGVSRKAGYRALQSLEAAGLVMVERRRGRCSHVTICRDAR